MGQVTSTTAIQLVNNIREDLGDVIFNVSPFQTPFTSGIPQTTATADNHEWLTDSLAAAATNNAIVEADEQAGVQGTARTRKGNFIQISKKTVAVTKKAEMFDRAGVPGKEMAYQLVKLGKELQMDVEAQTLQCYGATSASVAGTINATKRQGTATLPGVSAAFGSWINTNEEKNGGTDNTASDGTTVPVVAGSTTALNETKLQNLLDGVWNNSGDFTNTKIMASAATVTSLRALKGMATSVDTDASTNEIISRVAVYQSQFGPLAVVPNKHMPVNTMYIMDYNTWGIAFGGGNKIHTTDISTKTSAEQKLLEIYYTLEARSEEANGAYYNIT